MWSIWTMHRGLGLVAFPQQSPTAPLALPLGPSSQLVPALGMVATCGPILVVDWLSLSICSSNMEVVTSACWWASLASVSSHSPKVSCLSLWKALSQWQDGRVLVASSSPLPSNWSPLLHCRQSFKEDKMSLVTSHTQLGPHSGIQATSLACTPDGRVPNFFSECLVSYKLDGRYIYLRVQPWETMLVTAAN